MAMKNVWFVVLVMLVLAGCSGSKEEATAAAGPPLVYASNYPLAYFAQQIAGESFAVRMPVPADQDPAYWQPSVEDVLAMQQADLILLNGATYEGWLKIVSLPSSLLVDTSMALEDQLIPTEEATHSHGPGGAHQHTAMAFTTWLDLSLAIRQAEAVKDAFVARWPGQQALFESRFKKLALELSALDQAIQDTVGADPGRLVFFSHPVYQYFQKRYGINGRSVHWEPEVEITDEMLADLVKACAGHPAAWMLWEGTPLPESIERLKAKGISSVVLSPCAGTPEEGDLMTVMKANLEALETVYGGM
jgi:zinc transport system substrate-binding protein